jgi:hypothetical protein
MMSGGHKGMFKRDNIEAGVIDNYNMNPNISNSSTT